MEELSFGVDIPFVQHLGFRLALFEGGRSRLEFDPRPEHLNSFAVVHGGAVMTLLDVAMASAARSVQPQMGVVTIELKSSFMRPSKGALSCHGKLMHRTATLAFVEATVMDAQGQPCAHGTGTFKYVRRLATGARSVHELGVISTD
ncbi:PaaI family thioesterase [Ramlibacter sp. AW1]|uniref:PaaI family thioesterase n=1 Tax=Ramlibacter aurantiacus TaxID=2801330 RepID=A0A937D1I1_9BURK|nr:PaaI family thioesterase [Ramlibacter aurantiacus]MBL0418805.1 PaaI family thioesterase [Ramlibacter aurantiacus]